MFSAVLWGAQPLAPVQPTRPAAGRGIIFLGDQLSVPALTAAGGIEVLFEYLAGPSRELYFMIAGGYAVGQVNRVGRLISR